MSAHPQGSLTVKANGKEYKLWVGISVLADLQAKHGQNVLERLDPPAGASEAWMPDLNILVDLFLGALQRYHADDADRYLVDEIMAQNGDAFAQLMGASMPDATSGKTKAGNARSRTRAA